jgi:hypothetical protein
MKNLHIKIVCLLCVVLSVSCSKDFLDRKPQNIIAADAAYSSLSGIEALTAGLYQTMPTENFTYYVPWEPSYLSAVCDEACGSYGWVQTNDPVIGDGWTPWFRYDYVRNVNDFIEQMATANIDEDLKSRFTAEARFIRAFYYFGMVKRYGGIPLITTVQQFTGSNLEELKVPRNSEKEVYDFIAKELDEAALALPETYPAKDRHRASRYAALALKSRAMLYAASVAEYGTVQLNGLLGFPSSDATDYWQKSYDASKQILGKFELYNANPDKAANFQELFLKEAGNPEVILSQVYQSPDLVHSFDFYNAPQSFKFDYGNLTNPTCDFVEEYEYTDGSNGALKVKDAAGVPILYSSTADLFKDKDPRLLGSIMTPSSAWQGGVIEIRRGVIDGA